MNKKPNPTMQSCESSQVKSHGHCADTNTLCVEYASGGRYHYEGVSAEQYTALCKAESVGKHLHANIKGNHKFTKQKEN
jgi:hypothetical protein